MSVAADMDSPCTDNAKLQTFHSEVQDAEGLKKRRIVRRADFDKLDKAVYLWLILYLARDAFMRFLCVNF